MPGFSCFIGGVRMGVAGCRVRDTEVGVGFEGLGDRVGSIHSCLV